MNFIRCMDDLPDFRFKKIGKFQEFRRLMIIITTPKIR
jgi:hypothetical protein